MEMDYGAQTDTSQDVHDLPDTVSQTRTDSACQNPGRRPIADETGKKPGRGLYVCRSEECLSKALKGARLEKAAGVHIGEEVMASLKEKAEHGASS